MARKRYPGKFEACDDDRLAEVLHGIDTNADCGDVQTTGWYGLVLHRNHGYIVSEDSQGFFCYEYFDTKAEAEKEYSRIESEIAEDLNDEPQPEDITISDSGPLGSLYSVGIVEGKFIGEYRTWEDTIAAIREHMEGANFFPTVWKVSDHGNAHTININEEVS